MSRYTIALIAAAFALLAVVSADIDLDMKTIFAGKGSKAIGVHATKQLIASVVDEFAATQKQNLATDNMFRLFFMRLSAYRNACIPDKAQCERNLELLERFVNEREMFEAVNLMPYLRLCYEEQKIFCA